MARNQGRVYVAVETGSAEFDGQTYPFTAGVTRVREGHPLLKNGRDKLFALADDTPYYEFDWESATATPGDKRGG